MFFPRLRKKAKWVFLFLALAFAFGFVGFGVGAGGSGIGDYFAELFNRVPSTGQPSVDEAKKDASENPTDPQAQLDLANAYQTDGQTEPAIEALKAYLVLKPDDADALQQLASLYITEGSDAQQAARNAQLSGGAAAFATTLFDSSKPVGKTMVAPITDVQQQRIQGEYTTALIKGQAAFTNEADTWDKLIKLQPDEKSFYLSARDGRPAGERPAARGEGVRGVPRRLAGRSEREADQGRDQAAQGRDEGPAADRPAVADPGRELG